MPDLGPFDVPQYQPGQPYHYEYDNLPLKTLARRDELINTTVDILAGILENTAGTQGTLSNRLNQSIDADGNLKSTAVDQADHNIAYHIDGSRTVDPLELSAYQALGFPSLTNPVDFVRMLASERYKLADIADNATNLTIDVATVGDGTITFGDGAIPVLSLEESDSIAWSFVSPNGIKAELKYDFAFAHRHYYDIVPLTGDYQNYQVNGLSTPYREGSLRVYINGVRLSSNSTVNVPNYAVSAYTENMFTPDHLNGTFALDVAIDPTDVITIDFDTTLS
jgi:hypothetical protein